MNMEIRKFTASQDKFEIVVTYVMAEQDLNLIANSNLDLARKLLKYHFGENAPLKLLLHIRNFFNNGK